MGTSLLLTLWCPLMLRVADILGGLDEDGVFADVFGMISDPLQEACDENEMEVAFQRGCVGFHDLEEGLIQDLLSGIQLLIAKARFPGGNRV